MQLLAPHEAYHAIASSVGRILPANFALLEATLAADSSGAQILQAHPFLLDADLSVRPIPSEAAEGKPPL